MEEFEPKRRNKIINKDFVAKYAYVLVLAVLLIGGISYGYTFFTQNKKIVSGSITTANLTINFGNRDINASNLFVPTDDQEGLSEFSKSLTVTNQTAIEGKFKLTLTRTSGLTLNDLRYALIINNAIQEVADVPVDGEILSSAIMGNETVNVEVRLWPKTTYSGSETTFVGEIEAEIKYLGNTATDLSNPEGKYVNFNCSSTCEVWQIVKKENGRLVLTRQADYSGATSRTNSNKYDPNSFNPVITFNDDSMITSLSTDGLNVYLAKTVKVSGGEGTQANPYELVNNDFREPDKKVLAVITYKDGSDTTVGTQNIYYNENNYISKELDDPDFESWTDGTSDYVLGDTITFTSDTNLTANMVPRLRTQIMAKCNDSSITYVRKYNGVAIDTPDGTGSEDVCYFKSTLTTASESDPARMYSNVIFGDYCWQIVRTTKDGGIKLIYNGPKTSSDTCPYAVSSRIAPTTINGQAGNVSTTMSGDILYGTGFTYSGTTFTLTDTFTANWSGDYDNDGVDDYKKIIGTYTCKNTNSSCSTLYYVGSYQSTTEAATASYTLSNSFITGDYYTIGTSAFNADFQSLALTGYMFNDTYNGKLSLYAEYIDMLESNNMTNTSYYYGEQAVWNNVTNTYDLKVDDGNGNYITPTSTTSWTSIRSNVQGMYTCLSDTDTSCATVHYAPANFTSNELISVPLSNNEDIDAKSIIVGTGYEKNGSNYSLTGQNSILLKNWYTNYSQSGYKYVYICSDYVSTSCSRLYYITGSTRSTIERTDSNNNFYFGNSVTYSNGNYTIDTDVDTTKYHQVWDMYNDDIINSHYTCFRSDTNSCGDTVYYVFYKIGATLGYIELKNGEKIDDAMNKMINMNNSSTSDINKYNSAIKGVLDNWFRQNIAANNLSQFTDENAVYCNNRKPSNLGGWGQGNNTSSPLTFSNSNLSCDNITDRFSVNNNKAKLTYSVGLLTYYEASLMYTGFIREVESGSRSGFHLLSLIDNNVNAATNHLVNYNGTFTSADTYYGVRYNDGVRPVIVLKPGITISSGNGTYDTPYIIDTTSS